MDNTKQGFEPYLRELLSERQIDSFEELARKLLEAGYPYGADEVHQYVASAGGPVKPPGDRVWAQAVSDVLGLSTEEKMTFAYAFVFGVRPHEEAA